MMARAPRYVISPSSPHQLETLEAWARLEGRTLSSLCAMLLEQGIRQAEHDGTMPQPIADRLRFRQ